METRSTDRSYVREFLRSKSGVAGLAMLLLLVAFSIFAVVTIPQSEIAKWQNPAAWQGDPASAPPTWVNYFGVDAPQTITLGLTDWANDSSASGSAYTDSASFTWDHAVTPSELMIAPNFSGDVYDLIIIWTKPDGDTVQMSVSSPEAGTGYYLTSPPIEQGVTQYIQSQTSTYLSSVGPTVETAALFNEDGPGLLNNSVQEGSYSVTLQVLGQEKAAPTTSQVSIIGDSYGTMGTDNVGRPIDLGVLAGLPWALEIGALSSAVSVVGGILWGGFAGFFGGWREKVMSWGTLVVLAIPGLVFVVALSYTITLSLFSEALIIAALSWPFFAIIAKSVTISIRSQTYVEADRAMGISGARTFVTHFLPRLTPVTIAFTALSVSAFIIFGETLAFLGIEPPNVVTWGGILNDAIAFDASVHGWWWWIGFPGAMIVVASMPFVLVGFALDRVVAPRVTAK